MSGAGAAVLPYLGVFVCLALACFAPRFGDRFFAPIEKFAWRLAGRKTASIATLALATVAIRVSLIGLMPPPVPHVEDEFSYLLAGDTYAHGRLTNPTSPLWRYFDTIHVNQRPTYMSKYPPAQGAVLAAGELLGNPWIGAILSAAAMCAAVAWMLQGWLPPRWALLGGILVMFELCIFGYWMNSYWGGAVPAAGGALVLGALPRLTRWWHARDAVVLGLGAAILGNSRPFEGFFLCLPVFVALCVRLLRMPRASARVALPRLMVPLCLVGISAGAFMAYDNWRTTGDPWLPPYTLNERTYLAATPLFVWQPLKPPLHFGNPQLNDFYGGLTRRVAAARRVTGVMSAVRNMGQTAVRCIRFFLGPALVFPLLVALWLFHRRGVRFLLGEMALGFAALWSVTWFEPHYLSPLTAVVFALTLQGIRHMRRWRFRGRPVGIGLSRVVVLAVPLLALFGDGAVVFKNPKLARIESRSVFSRQLNAAPGKHLVIVRYAPGHDVGNHEWVYNGADLEGSKVIWAREIPGVDMQPLLDHYRGRHVWVAEPDASPPRLTPQTPANQ